MLTMSWTRGLTTINLGRVACSAAIAALLALPTSVRAQDEGDFDEELDTPMAEFGSLEEPSNAFHAPVDDELAARTDQSDHSEAQVSTDEYELVDLAVLFAVKATGEPRRSGIVAPRVLAA